MRVPPATVLGTHTVLNQPPPLADRNLYDTDRALRDAVALFAGPWLDARASALGAEMGAMAALEDGEAANRHPPELLAFDRFGQRLDEVRFHPSYHALMGRAMAHRIHDIAWAQAGEPGRHLAHAVLLAVFTQAEAGTMCPVNMTYAAVPALRACAAGGPWLDRLVGGAYDGPLRPIAEKAGVTLGMAMTEKQGGSDVRANTTRAERDGAAYRITGHKWFCSAPMSDGVLALAQAPEGLGCFLVPRVRPDGTRNAIRLQRLKDKLGNRSNASAEIEFEGAFGWPVGEPGRGVRAIIPMVHHTRLGTVAATIGVMRRALAEAMHHAGWRQAFGRPLIRQPAMAALLADLAIDYEAAVLLMARVARAYAGEGEEERALARLGVALAKFALGQRCPGFVFECMSVMGGNGYAEEGPMPRLFREAPLNAIWEGTGTVMALDALRSLERDPAAREALRAEIAPARGADPDLDRAIAASEADLLSGPAGEAAARRRVDRLALVLQGALLVRHAPGAMAQGFCRARLSPEAGRLPGALPDGVDVAAVLARHAG